MKHLQRYGVGFDADAPSVCIVHATVHLSCRWRLRVQSLPLFNLHGTRGHARRVKSRLGAVQVSQVASPPPVPTEEDHMNIIKDEMSTSFDV